METRQYNVYKYEELTDKAKEKARDYFREGNDYPWFSECRESLEGFESNLPIKITDYSYGERGRDYIKYDVTDENTGLLKGLRLRTWLINNFWNKLEKGKFRYTEIGDGSKVRYSKMDKEVSYPFTGFWIDADLLDPIREFLKNPTKDMTFDELIDDCLHSFMKAIADDIEYQNSDEAIEETIQANDYNFTEDGRID